MTDYNKPSSKLEPKIPSSKLEPKIPPDSLLLTIVANIDGDLTDREFREFIRRSLPLCYPRYVPGEGIDFSNENDS